MKLEGFWNTLLGFFLFDFIEIHLLLLLVLFLGSMYWV